MTEIQGWLLLSLVATLIARTHRDGVGWEKSVGEGMFYALSIVFASRTFFS